MSFRWLLAGALACSLIGSPLVRALALAGSAAGELACQLASLLALYQAYPAFGGALTRKTPPTGKERDRTVMRTVGRCSISIDSSQVCLLH